MEFFLLLLYKPKQKNMIALYILAGIIVVVILLIILAPTDFKIECQTTVNKPKDEVFAYLKSLKNQDNWSTWNLKDPNMKKNFKGTDATVGCVSAWDSTDKNVGKGEQEIIKITEGERVDFELRFEKPMKVTHHAYLSAIAKNGSTEVAWGFTGKSKRPMNVMSLLAKGMIVKSFNEGLLNLKTILEK